MVLGSMPKPAWLSDDAPYGEFVLSTRVRFMRNLEGFWFPHHAPDRENESALSKIRNAFSEINDANAFEFIQALSLAEREYWVACRMVSPEFPWHLPGRSVIMDKLQERCAMINEEDHLRLQALTAGFSPERAVVLAENTLRGLEGNLRFAQTKPGYFLAASPANCGVGRRISAMFHLIGLAHAKRLPAVIQALNTWGISPRGLFGEASRAIGAFVQVSITHSTLSEFFGACEYLIKEERQARSEISHVELSQRVETAIRFATTSRSLTLADALRVTAWVRWGTIEQVIPSRRSYREIDAWFPELALLETLEPEIAARERAAFFRYQFGR